jgi:hypothetical protein
MNGCGQELANLDTHTGEKSSGLVEWIEEEDRVELELIFGLYQACDLFYRARIIRENG